MNKRINTLLVTGASGFVGQHLLAALSAKWPGAMLHATSSSADYVNRRGLASPNEQLRWHPLDIRSVEQVAALIKTTQPNAVLHLAAQSHVPTSFKQVRYTWDVNLQGTLNVLEGIKHHCPDALMVNVGSSDMYGGAFQSGQPVVESSAFMPLNPYAASKASADLAVGQYAASEGIKALRARPFNHTGPGQREDFVLASFAIQIARIEQGQQPPVVETGDLSAERDFLDVDDVCQAYIALLELPSQHQQGQPFNIASGKSLPISELLNQLLALSSVAIEHRLDPARQRPSDIPRVQASNTAIQHATGWVPRHSSEQMLARLLEECRHRKQQAP